MPKRSLNPGSENTKKIEQLNQALEAMLARLPVLISTQCGCANDVVTEETGWKFSPWDEEALASITSTAWFSCSIFFASPGPGFRERLGIGTLQARPQTAEGAEL